MSIFKKKLVSITALACAFVCCMVLGLSFIDKPQQPAVAESAVQTYNAEDLTLTPYAGRANSINGFYTAEFNNAQTVTTGYSLYVSDKSATEDSTNSISSYAGNLTLETTVDDEKVNTNNSHGVMLTRKDGTSTDNTIVSFRTKWQGTPIYLLGQIAENYCGTLWAQNGGYRIAINAGNYLIQPNYGGANSDVTHTTAIKSAASYNNSAIMAVGDDLLITYGTKLVDSKAATDTTVGWRLCYYYLKVAKVDANGNQTVLCDHLQAPIETTAKITEPIAHNGKIKAMYVTSVVGYKLLVGGVESPLYSASADKTIEEVQTVGTSLSSIALPEGCAFVNADDTVVAGLGAYKISTGKYYENTLYASALITGEQNVINVEDKINKVDGEMNVHPAFNQAHIAGGPYNYVWNTTDATFSPSNNTTVYYYALHDVKADEGDIRSDFGAKDRTAYTNADDASTWDKANNVQTNLNKYDGNISLWMSHNFTRNSGTGTSGEMNAFVGLNIPAAKVNDVLKMRITYNNYAEYNFATGSAGYHYVGAKTLQGLHVIWDTRGGDKISIGRGLGNDVLDYTGYNAINAKAITTGLTDGEDVIVTFGIYDTVYNGVATKGLIFKLEKVDGTSIFENVYIDTDPANTVTTGNTYFVSMGNYVANAEQDTVLHIAGINAPLFAESEIVKSTAKGFIGDRLANVTLEEGLAFKNPDQIIVENGVYEGTKEYYGKTYDVQIQIVAEQPDTTTVVFKDALGASLDMDVVLSEFNTELSLQAFAASGKQFIGWKDKDDKLYNAGDIVSYKADVDVIEFTLAQIDFKLVDGASVRFAYEKGFGGLRYTLAINMAEYNTYADYISNVKSAIAPVDTYFNTGAFVDGQTSVASSLDLANVIKVEGDLTHVAFAITNIKYTNFARQFGGVAFFTVTYADGDTRVVSTAFDLEKNARSIYQVSSSLLASHYADIEVGSGFGKFDAGELEFLNGYVNQVADVKIVEDVDTNELQITKQGDAPYTISANAEYDEEKDNYTVALTITFAEGNGFGADGTLSTTTQGKYIVPVIVNDINEMTNVDSAVVQFVSASEYENNAVTITFVYDPRG